jgi:hypothetical protein
MFVTPNVRLLHVGAYLNPDAEPAPNRSAQDQRGEQRARLRADHPAADTLEPALGPGGQSGRAALKLSTGANAS